MKRSGYGRARSLAIAIAVAAGVSVPAAFADTGDLGFRSCIVDNEVTEARGCATSAPALSGARSVTEWFSTVHVAAFQDAAIANFERNLDDGSLTYRNCFETGREDCSKSGRVAGLNSASSVHIPIDGHSLYATSEGDNTVLAFDRTLSGRLTSLGCIEDVEGSSGCAENTQGLDGARDVETTQRAAWVAGSGDDAVVAFRRSRSKSELTPDECVRDTEADTDCKFATAGLNGARSLAVTEDRTSLYVASETDDSLVHLRPNTRTGRVSRGTCVNEAADAGCASAAPGLNGAFSVAVSPDGRSVYAVGAISDSVVQFERNTTNGALTFRGCIHNGSSGGGCTGSADGLDGPRSVAVSPDGRSVYVASSLDDALVGFDRDPGTGDLSGATCFEAEAGDGCTGGALGLAAAYSVTVGRDGRSVYVAGYDDDAIATFAREPLTGRLRPLP